MLDFVVSLLRWFVVWAVHYFRSPLRLPYCLHCWLFGLSMFSDFLFCCRQGAGQCVRVCGVAGHEMFDCQSLNTPSHTLPPLFAPRTKRWGCQCIWRKNLHNNTIHFISIGDTCLTIGGEQHVREHHLVMANWLWCRHLNIVYCLWSPTVWHRSNSCIASCCFHQMFMTIATSIYVTMSLPSKCLVSSFTSCHGESYCWR